VYYILFQINAAESKKLQELAIISTKKKDVLDSYRLTFGLFKKYWYTFSSLFSKIIRQKFEALIRGQKLTGKHDLHIRRSILLLQ